MKASIQKPSHTFLKKRKNFLQRSCFGLHCFLLILSVIFLSQTARSQQPWTYQMTTYDGLPSNTVYWMLKDSKGYMWFGTENGLTRYDGVEFKVYQHEDLMSYDFNSVHEDAEGNIWSHNFDNQIVQIKDDKLSVYDHPIFNQQGYYIEMVVGKHNNIYIKAEKRLLQYFPEQDTFKTIFHKPKKSLSFLTYAEGRLAALVSDSTGTLRKYLSYDEANERLNITELTNPMKKRLRTYQIDGQRMLIGDLYSVAENIYTIRNDSIVIFESLKKYDIPGNFKIYNIKLIGSDIWYCTNKGAIRRKDGLILLPGINTANMLQDKDGNLWISSLKKGVFVFTNLNIQLYNTENSELPVSALTSIALDETGNLFLGTSEGRVIYWDTENDIILDEYNTNTGQDISDVFYNPKSQSIWITGMFQFKKGEPKYKQAVKGVAMKQAFTLPNDELLIRSSRYRLNHLNVKDISVFSKEKFSSEWIRQETYVDVKEYCSPKNINIINTIHYEAQKDRIWMALHKNTVINTREGIDTFFLENKTPLEASCFGQSSNGNEMWIGTRKGGFIVVENDTVRLDCRSEQYKSYGEIEQIKHGQEYVWMRTKNALIVVDNQGNILNVYNQESGVPTRDVTDMAIWENKAWLCTKNGLLSIYHQKSIKTRQSPIPRIRSIQIQGKSVELDTTYELQAHENTIQINFRGISTKPKSDFKYRYRLRDIEDWDTVNRQIEYARYLSLSSGSHTFEFEILGSDSKTLRINFDIATPIWKRLWFILLCALLTILGLYYFYRRHIKRIERRNHYEQQLRSSQLVALRTQMNPHFVFNSLNSIQEFIILNEKILANEYLSKFSKLMRVYLNHSSKNWVLLDEELEALRLYLELEQLRFEDAKINLSVDPALDNEEIHIPPLFIQPYVENAFKHGLLHKKTDRKLDVSFKKINQQVLEIVIEDNGVGREKAIQIKKNRQNTNDSFSITANQKRLNLLNYNRENSIKVNIFDLSKNNIPSGTQVIIHLPINYHYE